VIGATGLTEGILNNSLARVSEKIAKKLQQNDKQLHKEKLENSVFRIRVGWIRIQSREWIRIQGNQNRPQKKGKKSCL
jgi:hypothetical protein